MVEERPGFWLIAHPGVFYALSVVALVFFGLGMGIRVRAWIGGTRGTRGQEVRPDLSALLVDGLLGRRIFSGDRAAGVMHLGLAWGFAGLFAGTVLNAVHEHVVPFLEGPVYLVYSACLEVAGLFLLAGVGIALWRRLMAGVDRLERSWSAYVVPVWLGLVVVTGFLVEGVRLGHQAPAWASWSFVGRGVAGFLLWVGLDPDGLGAVYPWLWWIHAGVALALVGFLPWTRLVHALVAPFSIALHRVDAPVLGLEAGGVDLAEGDVPRFTRVQRVAFDACTHCGRCVAVCPAHLAGEPFDPRAFVVSGKSRLPGLKTGDVGFDPSRVWHCATCRACVEVCPVHVPIPEALLLLRAALVEDGTRVPAVLSRALDRLYRYQNPWESSRRRRNRWVREVRTRTVEREDASPLLYFVGCTASLDDRASGIPRALAQVLDRARRPFVTLGRKEPCCGDIARVVGEQCLCEEQFEGCVTQVGRQGVLPGVTSSPHCLHTFRHVYPRLLERRGTGEEAGRSSEPVSAGGNRGAGSGVETAPEGWGRVLHHVELVRDLLAAGWIRLEIPVARVVTFHDPCYLGRHNGIYGAPRQVIDAVPGVQRVEMAHHHGESLCCGGGGGRMWVGDLEADVKLSELRIREAIEAGADILCTACPLCLVMLEDARRSAGVVDRLEVMDVVELVARSLGEVV